MMKVFGNFLNTHNAKGENLYLNVNHISAFYREQSGKVFIAMSSNIVYELKCDFMELDRALTSPSQNKSDGITPRQG